MSTDQSWIFTSTQTDPAGFRVTITVEVPGDHIVEHVRDCAELTQMATSQCAKRIADSVHELEARIPF